MILKIWKIFVFSKILVVVTYLIKLQYAKNITLVTNRFIHIRFMRSHSKDADNLHDCFLPFPVNERFTDRRCIKFVLRMFTLFWECWALAKDSLRQFSDRTYLCWNSLYDFYHTIRNMFNFLWAYHPWLWDTLSECLLKGDHNTDLIKYRIFFIIANRELPVLPVDLILTIRNKLTLIKTQSGKISFLKLVNFNSMNSAQPVIAQEPQNLTFTDNININIKWNPVN